MSSTASVSILLIQDLAVLLLAATLAGWVCDRLGISRVVGFLGAGVLIGTPQITWIYVTDESRIQTLSQLGLVFLMFFIGLSFRLRKLRELGPGIIAATVFTAMITLTLTRLLGGALGFNTAESLFLAAMLMVSSSAIVGKVLSENGLVHERAGQLAMAMTLLEDLVAIILLAWLGSYAASESGVATSWKDSLTTIGSLAAFIVLLIIPGVLFVPKILKKLAKKRAFEQETLLVASLMFGMALLTVKSGFSLALGAFLCGVIVAESPRIRAIESNFSGLRDIFMTVFFTAVGMSIDITALPEALSLILLGVALAFVVRIFASATGLLLAAETESTSLKAALCLTPIGEFSFVIASLGISAGLLDPSFQVAAVGISFVTSLISPAIMKKADTIAQLISPSRLKPVGAALETYRKLWADFGFQRKKSILWRILAPRLWQIGRELLLISAILIFARPIYGAFEGWIAKNHTGFSAYLPYYWLVIGLACLPSTVALYRNLNAIAMIVGDYFTEGQYLDKSLKGGLTLILKSVSFFLVSLWIFNLVPFPWLDPYFLIAIITIGILVLLTGWRLLVRWHSHAEIALNEILIDTSFSQSTQAIRKAGDRWGLSLEEFVLPEGSPHAGQSIGALNLRAKTGAHVVGIERHGFNLSDIGSNSYVFSEDKLYLLGEPESLKEACKFLGTIDPASADGIDLTAAVLDETTIVQRSAWIGKSLDELRWPRLFGVQVVAVQREEKRFICPNGDWTFHPHDQLLLAGPRSSIEKLKRSQTTIENRKAP